MSVMPSILKLFTARASILLAERFLRLGAGAIVTILIARALGEEELGRYGYIMTWLAFLAPLSNMGLNNLVQKMAHEAQASPAAGSHSPQDAYQAILQTAVWLRLGSGILFALLLLLGFALFEPAYFMRAPWLLAALFVLQTFTALILYEYEQNFHGHFRAVALSKVLISFFTLGWRVAALYLGAGIETMLLIVGIEFLLTAMAQYGFARRYAPQNAGLTLYFFDKTAAIGLLKRAKWLWLSGIISVIYLKIDIVMIKAMLGEGPTGQYVALSRISELWYVIPIVLAARYYPDFVKTWDQPERYYLMMVKRCSQFFALGVLIAIGMTVFASDILRIAFGESYAASASVLQIHVWAGCFIFVRSLISQHLIISQQEPLSLLSHGVGALLNVGLNLLLIPRFGLEGAAWATLISYAYASFFFLFFAKTTRAQMWQAIGVAMKHHARP
jgi:O-antigen/teichoic acid export membrane protein